MRWLLTYLCPPLAVLSCGKPFSAILNVFLTLCLWKPGMRHAQFVLVQHLDNRRTDRLTDATHQPEWTKYFRPMLEKANRPEKLPVHQGFVAKLQADNDPAVGMNGTRFRRRS